MKIGMLFPGYGSQVVGMGKEIYDESRIMQEYFEEASNCLDINFVKLCFASSDIELGRAENAYPALFLVTSALAMVLKEHNIIPQVVAGYNLGEYAAIHAVGGMNLPDGLYLLAKYASLYQAIIETMDLAGIAISGMSEQDVQELCSRESNADDRASIAIYNNPLHHVVMGSRKAVENVAEHARDVKKVKIQEVELEQGLHSAFMDPVVANFKMYLEKVDFKDLAIPLVSSVDAQLISRSDDLKTAILRQIHSPIKWTDVMDSFVDCDLIIEVGPGKFLCNLMNTVYPEKQCVTFNKKSDIEEIQKIIQTSLDEPENSHGDI